MLQTVNELENAILRKLNRLEKLVAPNAQKSRTWHLAIHEKLGFFFHEKHLFHISTHCLVLVLRCQVVLNRNPKTGWFQHESPSDFEGPPSDFWKISRNEYSPKKA